MHELPPPLPIADPLDIAVPEIGAFAFEAILPLATEACMELPLDVEETDEGGRPDWVEGVCF